MKKYSPYKQWTLLSILCYSIFMIVAFIVLPLMENKVLNPVAADIFTTIGWVILSNTILWFPVTLYRFANIDNRITEGSTVLLRSDNRIGVVKSIYDESIMERQYEVHIKGSNTTIVTTRVQLYESKNYGYSKPK